MTSEDVKSKINSCLADINQLVMAEHQFEEDRIDIIRFAIVSFFQQPYYKYYEKVKDDYPEKTEEEKEFRMKLGVRIFLAYLFFALISGAMHAGFFWTFSAAATQITNFRHVFEGVGLRAAPKDDFQLTA